MELYITNEDGKKLYCRNWFPSSGPPKAVLFLCHGWAEHLGYYESLAQEVNKLEIYCVGHDLVGHGKSGGIPVHIDNFHEYVRDVWQHIDMLCEDYGNLPFFILGHSMGGTVAIKVAEERPRFFKGVILVAPLVRTDFLHAYTSMMARFSAVLFPYIYSRPLDLTLLSRNPATLKQMEEDELRWKRGFRSKWTVCMMNVLSGLEKSFGSIEYPLYLIHGDDDKLCNLNGSQILFTRACSKDKTFRIIEGAYHGLFVELPEVSVPIQIEIGEWITRRIKESPRVCITILTKAQIGSVLPFSQVDKTTAPTCDETINTNALSASDKFTNEKGIQAPSYYQLASAELSIFMPVKVATQSVSSTSSSSQIQASIAPKVPSELAAFIEDSPTFQSLQMSEVPVSSTTDTIMGLGAGPGVMQKEKPPMLSGELAEQLQTQSSCLSREAFAEAAPCATKAQLAGELAAFADIQSISTPTVPRELTIPSEIAEFSANTPEQSQVQSSGLTEESATLAESSPGATTTQPTRDFAAFVRRDPFQHSILPSGSKEDHI